MAFKDRLQLHEELMSHYSDLFTRLNITCGIDGSEHDQDFHNKLKYAGYGDANILRERHRPDMRILYGSKIGFVDFKSRKPGQKNYAVEIESILVKQWWTLFGGRPVILLFSDFKACWAVDISWPVLLCDEPFINDLTAPVICSQPTCIHWQYVKNKHTGKKFWAGNCGKDGKLEIESRRFAPHLGDKKHRDPNASGTPYVIIGGTSPILQDAEQFLRYEFLEEEKRFFLRRAAQLNLF